jgi:uncharacterized protein
MAQHEPEVSVSQPSRSPVRTCIGCRERVQAVDLLRVVVRKFETDGSTQAASFELVPDPKRRLPGRGAWLHPDSSCLALAERRRAFGRALRVSGILDNSALVRVIDAVPAGGQAQ